MGYIQNQNPKGGIPLTNIKLEEDKDTGCLCYKIGYCSSCGYPQRLRTVEARPYFAQLLGIDIDNRPKRPIKVRIGEWLLK